jgi:hypothetical protein
VPGAEVVDGEVHAHRVQLFDDALGFRCVGHRGGLCHLEYQAVALQAGLGQDVAHQLRKLWFELTRRQVHRDLDVACPPDGFRARGAQYPLTEMIDETAGFRDWHELHRPEEATFGMLPTHECLGADDPARREFLDRLVVQDEFAGTDRELQGLFGVEANERVQMHVGAVAHVPAATSALRFVHREVGAVQQRLAIRLGELGDRDPDAAAHRHVAAVDNDWLE